MTNKRKVRIEGVRVLTVEEKSQRKRRLLGVKHEALVPADDQFVMCLRALGWMNSTHRLWDRRMAQAMKLKVR
jgi:hypothetical protein